MPYQPPRPKLMTSAARGPIVKLLPEVKTQLVFTLRGALPMLPRPHKKDTPMPTPPKTDRRAKPFKKLPIEGILKITDKLREVCSKGEDGLAIYADGWNDKSVAETLNLDHPTPEKYVAFYRGKLFGRVRPVSQPRQAGIAAEASARIAKLETAVHKLLSHLGCDPAEFGL